MQRMIRTPALCLALFAAAPTVARAQQVEPSRARLFVNGAFGVTSLDFSEARRYTLFAEESTLNAAYEAKSGLGFEAGLQYRFLRHLGVAASFASADRDESASAPDPSLIAPRPLPRRALDHAAPARRSGCRAG